MISISTDSGGSYWGEFSCVTVHYTVQDGSNIGICEQIPEVWPFKSTLLSSTFLWGCLLYPQGGSNFGVQGGSKFWARG